MFHFNLFGDNRGCVFECGNFGCRTFLFYRKKEFDMARKKCCICGREMSSFSLNCIPLNVVVGGTRPVECRDCYKIHKYEKLEFYPDGKVFMEGKAVAGFEPTSKEPQGYGRIIAIIASIVALVCVLCMCSSGGGSGSSTRDSSECKSCHRTYYAGDSAGNYMNIARTGMCNNCYDNFKWAQDALGN